MFSLFSRSSKEKKVDVDAVVHKLKSLYREYGERYGKKLFNLEGFENRYHDALINRLNLNAFLHAEITVFEELKRRVAEKGKPSGRESSESSYGEIANRIVEENLERVRKYRCIDFHPDAEEETKYLMGAVTDFYYREWNKATKLMGIAGLKGETDLIHKLENDFSYYVVPIRGSYSRAVDDYLLVLSRKNPKESEKASVNFIKYGGILLNNCLRLFNDNLNHMRSSNQLQAQLNELEVYKNELIRIIQDFRLSDIRGY